MARQAAWARQTAWPGKFRVPGTPVAARTSPSLAMVIGPPMRHAGASGRKFTEPLDAARQDKVKTARGHGGCTALRALKRRRRSPLQRAGTRSRRGSPVRVGGARARRSTGPLRKRERHRELKRGEKCRPFERRLYLLSTADRVAESDVRPFPRSLSSSADSSPPPFSAHAASGATSRSCSSASVGVTPRQVDLPSAKSSAEWRGKLSRRRRRSSALRSSRRGVMRPNE